MRGRWPTGDSCGCGVQAQQPRHDHGVPLDEFTHGTSVDLPGPPHQQHSERCCDGRNDGPPDDTRRPHWRPEKSAGVAHASSVRITPLDVQSWLGIAADLDQSRTALHPRASLLKARGCRVRGVPYPCAARQPGFRSRAMWRAYATDESRDRGSAGVRARRLCEVVGGRTLVSIDLPFDSGPSSCTLQHAAVE